MTVAELYELFDLLRPMRRRAATALLEGDTDANATVLDRIARAIALLESLPGDGEYREFSAGGREVWLTLDYELTELARDAECLSDGIQHVLATLETGGEVAGEVSAIVSLIGSTRYRAVFSDRDGTLANYSGRYRSSHQPLYAAYLISRFASLADDFFVLSSGPLHGNGLASLCAFPDGTVHLAGSMGREYLLADGRCGRAPLSGREEQAIAQLDEKLGELLDRPEYRVLAHVGSGYQRKFGQLTVSRQDIHRSVPADVSNAFLGEVTHTLRELGDAFGVDGPAFTLDDTGFDIELTVASAGRRFTKGDGVRFICDDLGLPLGRGPVLVCGDTQSDVSMIEELVASGCETHAVFVAPDGDLARRVTESASKVVFCSRPDALVAALGRAGGGGEAT